MRQFDRTVAVKPLPVRGRGAGERLIINPETHVRWFQDRDDDPAVDQPALNVGRPLRSSAAPRRWGWRSWRHEIRAPHGRLVSIAPRLPRDERASASSSSALLAVNARFLSPFLSLFFFSPSVFLSLPSLANPPTRTRFARRSLARVCDDVRFPPVSEPVACVLRFWRSRGSTGSRGSSDSVVTIDDRYRIRTRGLTHQVWNRRIYAYCFKLNLSGYTFHWERAVVIDSTVFIFLFQKLHNSDTYIYVFILHIYSLVYFKLLETFPFEIQK